MSTFLEMRIPMTKSAMTKSATTQATATEVWIKSKRVPLFLECTVNADRAPYVASALIRKGFKVKLVSVKVGV